MTENQNGEDKPRSKKGFASMDEEKRRKICSKGGKAAHKKGTAHEFDSGEARVAGRLGGRKVSKNREHMAAIGRKGGVASRNMSKARNRDKVIPVDVLEDIDDALEW